MRAVVHRDLTDSSADFKRVVWPAVSGWCGGGHVSLVEVSPDQKMARNFDVLAGIDAWQITGPDGLMRGIASRVQWGTPWDSFTMRVRRPNGASTEVEKRIKAVLDIEAGWLRPTLTVQAYVSERGGFGRLQHVLMARTADLYRFAIEHQERIERRTNGSDQVEFWVVWAADLVVADIVVKRWTAADARPVGRFGWNGTVARSRAS